jgi:hypothetical protein
VAEWFKAPVLKTGKPAMVSRVRIPPLPPITPSAIRIILEVYFLGFDRHPAPNQLRVNNGVNN